MAELYFYSLICLHGEVFNCIIKYRHSFTVLLVIINAVLYTIHSDELQRKELRHGNCLATALHNMIYLSLFLPTSCFLLSSAFYHMILVSGFLKNLRKTRLHNFRRFHGGDCSNYEFLL
jgi:hypothetical protein